MAYVLEKITPEAQQRILEDAKSDPKIYQKIIRDINKFFFGNPNWAIDRKKRCYLYSIPSIAQCGPLFHFFYQEKNYIIEIEEGIYRQTSLVRFWPQSQPEPELLADLKYEIIEAFKVHGKSGIGNDDGMLTVNVIFEVKE